MTATEWQTFLNKFPGSHLLQTATWGDFKARFGWEVTRLASGDNGAQVLFRRLPLGFTLAYIPKGPVGNNWQVLLPELHALCRSKRAIALKIEPDEWGDDAAHRLEVAGFIQSRNEIQPRRTILIDLDGTEEDILARMKQKTRYNIRLSEKKGVSVRPSDDIERFHAMMAVTGQRDGFSVHSLDYYRQVYEAFRGQDSCELLVAEFEGQTLAAIMPFCKGNRAWYLYGASTDDGRNLMPTYLLQWEAMRWARQHGCKEYDLWGVPDEAEDALEAQFTRRHDGLWGVYRFKRGYGGKLVRSSGTWDFVYQPLLYKPYIWWAGRRGD